MLNTGVAETATGKEQAAVCINQSRFKLVNFYYGVSDTVEAGFWSEPDTWYDVYIKTCGTKDASGNPNGALRAWVKPQNSPYTDWNTALIYVPPILDSGDTPIRTAISTIFRINLLPQVSYPNTIQIKDLKLAVWPCSSSFTPLTELKGSIQVSPTIINFGNTAINSPVTQTIRLYNNDTAQAQGWLAAKEPFYLLNDGSEKTMMLPYTVGPENEQAVTLGFQPTTQGVFTGILTVMRPDPIDIDLHGASTITQAATSGVLINEVLPWNTNGLQDEHGHYIDWIELYNNNAFAVNLDGWQLSHTPNIPSGGTIICTLCNLTIQPNDFLILYASDECSGSTNQDLHLPFTLDEIHGGSLVLGINSPFTYPPAPKPNRSYYISYSASKSSAGTFGYPTPWAINNKTQYWAIPVEIFGNIYQHPCYGQLPDPYIQRSGFFCDPAIADPSSWVFPEEYLSSLNSITDEILQDDTGATFTNPTNPSQTYSVINDNGCNIEIQFLFSLGNQELLHMPYLISGYRQLYVSATCVPSETLIIGGRAVVQYGDGVHKQYLAGFSINSGIRNVFFIFPVYVNAHPVAFLHEFGHYTGLIGEWNRGVNTANIMDNGSRNWCRVIVSTEEQAYLEGARWGDMNLRKTTPPPALDELQYTQSEIEQSWLKYQELFNKILAPGSGYNLVSSFVDLESLPQIVLPISDEEEGSPGLPPF